MKVSKLWLQEWVNFSLTEKELASQLTMAGLEVDSVSPVAGTFHSVIVAEVLDTEPHPDADKLTLCEVKAGSDTSLKIVCGARNVRPGIKVALATIGAELPGGFKIKEAKLRGQLSQGMLCSVSELGLAEHSDGIMELPEDAPVGLSLREYLILDDEILDIDLTPNRADCFSVLGIARELSVLNNLPLQEPSWDAVNPTLDDTLELYLNHSEACPRYCGRIIRNINPEAKTPLWMAERLRRSGIRILHPIVDVMNYVMLELGQPMHAFDLTEIQGEIHIRFSHDKEQLTLLDGQELKLDDKVLVIADSKKPLAMAGIMGGAQSAVQAHTQDVFLESAYFSPIVIAGIARKYGLFSDSSQRFERGVDPYLQIKALERATNLILAIAGGKVGPIIERSDLNQLPKKKTFVFDTAKVKKLTGLSISQEHMKDLLQGLGVIVLKENSTVFNVEIPTYRFDIHQDIDLVEEIIRLYGYDKLKAEPMQATVQAGTTSFNESMAQQLALWFRSRGYNETISYSFVDPELQHVLYPQNEFMQLLNPISSELSQMRVGMWPGLIASMIHNIHRQQEALKFFELGVVFDVNQGELQERACIAGLLTGAPGNTNWCESSQDFDFFDLKGDIEALCSLLKIKQIEFIPTIHETLHPGKSAQINLKGQPAGWIGVLHPKLMDALSLTQEVILFEMSLDALMNSELPFYKTISKYPRIRRDLSFLVDKQVPVRNIEQKIRDCVKENWLKSFEVFDVYMGATIPEDKKSLAVALTLQDDKRTLVDAEINLLISAIIKTLEHEFSITLRE